jgi:ATP-dependent Lon protease
VSIPPITNPSEDQVTLPKLLPILPIDNAVLFPAMLLPLAISGDMWVKLVDDTALGDKLIGVFWRRQPGDSFDPLALARTGTGAQIVRMLRLPDGGVQLLLQGQARFRSETLLGADEVGVVTGLAWTVAGGDVLFVEASAVPGSGQLILTGQLGDVMRGPRAPR